MVGNDNINQLMNDLYCVSMPYDQALTFTRTIIYVGEESNSKLNM